MKKTLALVLALAMVFSTITVAFAEEPATIGADAQVCADLGMLKGATGTVDAAYLATAPQRIQAAVMFLRLKGLEAEAQAFTGAENFADADKAAWAKPIMAYLKAHPELGWAGDGTNFDPTGLVTAQQYYKVMLEALGFKQNSNEVVGDFTWENVIAFAAEKGLTKVAAVANFTVNDVAIATVEALKANVKEGGKTLAASLVEAGKVDKAKAVAANLYSEAVPAELKAVKSIANNKLEVVFAADASASFAEDVATYKVVEKGTTTAVEVKAAVAESATKAVVEVAALTAGKSYTMTIGAVSVNFTGIAKETAAPKIDSVKCIDTNTVEVTYDKVMDAASATNVANYTINNSVTVKAAVIDSDRKVVTLTTEGVANSKPYTLKVENVNSSDMVAIKAVSKNFTGKTDTTAPKISKFEVKNNELLRVTFSDAHGLSKASAETLANWSINDLEIESVTALDVDEDDYGYYEVVDIKTATQTAGKAYKLTINNLVDGSVAANAITKALTKDFKGSYADTSAPTVSTNPLSETNTSVAIVFSDKNALDVASATDTNNYEITYKDGATTETLEVVKAEIKDTDDMYAPAGKTIILTTAEQDDKYIYTLVIKDVADQFGNAIEPVSGSTYKKYTFRGMDEDVVPPYVASVSAVDTKTVKVVFDNKVQKASATDPTNYSLNNDLGSAIKASLSSTDEKTVTLTTAEQVVGKAYTITINGVKDLTGNELANVKANFVAARVENDTTAPEVAYIEALYNNEVRVHFTEAVKASGGSIAMSVNSGAMTFAAVGNILDDETTVVFMPNSGAEMENTKYTVDSISNVADKTGNKYVDPTTAHDFWGSPEANVGPEVVTWEQKDVKTIRVQFTDAVSLKASGYTSITSGVGTVKTAEIVEPDKDANGDAFATIVWTATVDPEGDANNEGYSTVDFMSDVNLPLTGDEIGFDFTDLIEDYVGTGAVDADDTSDDNEKTTLISTYLEDDVKPEIVNVEAVNVNKVAVTFSEDIQSGAVGSYKISYDDDGTTKYVTVSGVTRDSNHSKANIATSTALSADYVYTLVPLTGAKDLAGNTLAVKDVSFDFAGTNVTTQNYIKGVNILNATTFRVSKTSTISTIDHVYELDADGDDITSYDMFSSSTNDPDGDLTTSLEEVVVNRPLLSGTYYKVYVDGTAYKFEGITADSGILVTATTYEDDGVTVKAAAAVTFSGMDTAKQDIVAELADGTPLTLNATTLVITEEIAKDTVIYVKVTRKTDNVVLYAAKVKAQ